MGQRTSLVSLFSAVGLALATAHCGSAGGNTSAVGSAPGSDLPNIAPTPSSTAPESDPTSAPSSDPAQPAAAACNSDVIVAAISACIDSGKTPPDCLVETRATSPSASCDVDKDGLDDALEDAMLKSYSPVFAYNLGDGSHQAGDSEPNWPINANHFVTHSSLVWRVDDDSSTTTTVSAQPALADLPNATFSYQGQSRAASSPVLGQGPDFWLCLDQVNGAYTDETLVTTTAASRALPDGIDIFSVAHPSTGGATIDGSTPRYVVLEYMVLYAYNKFTLDNHEGDFEGGAVFVDMTTGDVSSVFTDRHATSDSTLLVPLEGPGAVAAKDPSNEAPHYDECSDPGTGPASGVRFWDFSGKKHHPMFYPAGGGHATYAYPGATKIQGVGCIEESIIRDVHNGNGAKLVPQDGAYYSDWGTTKLPVTNGVHFVNLGEESHLRAAWSAFKGQFGCTLGTIGKSYPGPWDNQRLCRHWLTNNWGDTLPFTPSTDTSCTE